MTKRTLILITVIFLLGAVLMSCFYYLSSHVSMIPSETMPMGIAYQPCCAFQALPDIHTVFQASVAPDTWRNILFALGALFSSIVFVRAVRDGTLRSGLVGTITAFNMRRAQHALSGFERMLFRGLAQPRLYESFIVLH